MYNNVCIYKVLPYTTNKFRRVIVDIERMKNYRMGDSIWVGRTNFKKTKVYY